MEDEDLAALARYVNRHNLPGPRAYWEAAELEKRINVYMSDTIQELKERIHEKKGYPIDQIRIHANGTTDHPDRKTLRECGISDDTEVRVEVLGSPEPTLKPLKIDVHDMELIMEFIKHTHGSNPTSNLD